MENPEGGETFMVKEIFEEWQERRRREGEAYEANLTLEKVTHMQRYNIGDVLAKFWVDGHALTSEQVMLEGRVSENWGRFHRFYQKSMGEADSVSLLSEIAQNEQRMQDLQLAFQTERSGVILADTAITVDRINWMRQQIAERMGGSTTVGAVRGLDYAAVVKAQTLQTLGLV